MSNISFLFTGKIYPEYFERFIECTKEIQNKIASIWENEDNSYIEKLKENNFQIVINNLNEQELYTPQTITIYNGLNYAKENGFEYTLRSRFDILSNDFLKYIEKTENLFKEKITVFCGVETSELYYSQLIIIGKINDMCRFHALQSINDSRAEFGEKFYLENYSNKTNLNKNDIKNILNFSLNICFENNIEFLWFRPESYRQHPGGRIIRSIPDMKIINEWARDIYIWT